MDRRERHLLDAWNIDRVRRLLRIALTGFLVVATFLVHLRPELIALAALAVATLSQSMDIPDGKTSRWRLAGRALILCAIAVAFGRLACDLAAEAARIPLLNPPESAVLAAAAAVFVAVVLLVGRLLGAAVAAIVVLVALHALTGHMMPGAAGHGLIRPSHFLDLMFFTTDGLLGGPLAVATGTVVHFLLFASILERSGATMLFCEIAERLAGRGEGATARVAVVSSALFGTISGSPTSDVVATGSMTIPAMRAAGYPATKAASIEVAASTGGSILPPVMGTAAFILADFTGTPYPQVLVAAAIPAVLYYATLLVAVTLDARQHGYGAREEAARRPGLARRSLQLLLPGSALVSIMLLGYPPAYAAGGASVVALLASALRPEGPLGARDILAAFETAGRHLVPVLAACAAAGIIIGSVTMSGLSGKTAALLLSASGGAFLPTLLICAAVGILFGLGMPTTSAYILGAMLLAPALTDMGVPLLPAHLFVLYFSVLSAMTPPVAVAAFAAASISGGSPYAIGVGAIRFASAAFLLPFGFALFPGLLMAGGALEVLADTIRMGAVLAAGAIAISGRLRNPLHGVERAAVALAALLLLTPDNTALIVGALALAAGLARQRADRVRPERRGLGRR